MVDRPSMLAQLVLHEGLRLRPYPDSFGNETCMVGYNVTARGWAFAEQVLGRLVTDPGPTLPWCTRAEALLVLGADLDLLEREVPLVWPFYAQLDEVRQRVALDMAFNLGTRVLGFHRTIAAVERRDWAAAARGLYASKWSTQVGDGPGKRWDRCDRLARMLLQGTSPTDVPSLPT